jgi:hypothetical protein
MAGSETKQGNIRQGASLRFRDPKPAEDLSVLSTYRRIEQEHPHGVFKTKPRIFPSSHAVAHLLALESSQVKWMDNSSVT